MLELPCPAITKISEQNYYAVAVLLPSSMPLLWTSSAIKRTRFGKLPGNYNTYCRLRSQMSEVKWLNGGYLSVIATLAS